jgi:hypothetical protein
MASTNKIPGGYVRAKSPAPTPGSKHPAKRGTPKLQAHDGLSRAPAKIPRPKSQPPSDNTNAHEDDARATAQAPFKCANALKIPAESNDPLSSPTPSPTSSTSTIPDGLATLGAPASLFPTPTTPIIKKVPPRLSTTPTTSPIIDGPFFRKQPASVAAPQTILSGPSEPFFHKTPMTSNVELEPLKLPLDLTTKLSWIENPFFSQSLPGSLSNIELPDAAFEPELLSIENEEGVIIVDHPSDQHSVRIANRNGFCAIGHEGDCGRRRSIEPISSATFNGQMPNLDLHMSEAASSIFQTKIQAPNLNVQASDAATSIPHRGAQIFDDAHISDAAPPILQTGLQTPEVNLQMLDAEHASLPVESHVTTTPLGSPMPSIPSPSYRNIPKI